ncbi:hypothetical protein Tco_0449295 [Tanacetum coccineum]
MLLSPAGCVLVNQLSSYAGWFIGEVSELPPYLSPIWFSPFLVGQMIQKWHRRSSINPTTSTPEISTTPIPPAPSAVVAPSTDIISHIDDPRYRLNYQPLEVPCCYVCCVCVHALRALVPSRADLLPPHKRFRDSISPEDSVKEDIDTNVLVDIEAYATAVGVAADMDVEAGLMQVGVDVVVGIDIPDGMLILDVAEHLEQVEEVAQDIYGHVMEIPLQRVEDIKTGQRELEARSLIAGGERASLLDQVSSLERRIVEFEATDDGLALAALRKTCARFVLFIICLNATRMMLGQLNGAKLRVKMRNGNGEGNEDRNGGGNGNENGGGNGNGNPNRNDRGVMPVARECTYHDFVKCQPLNFKRKRMLSG